MKPRGQSYQQAARSAPDRAQPVLPQCARETQDFNPVTAELPLGLPGGNADGFCKIIKPKKGIAVTSNLSGKVATVVALVLCGIVFAALALRRAASDPHISPNGSGTP